MSARQRGAALLTVLLLVAVMTVVAMGILDDVRFGLRRSANARALAQAQWYALGAETLARAQLARMAERDPGRTTLAGGWNGRPFVFPIEGGAIAATLRDGTACFNLNSAVEGGGAFFRRSEAGVAQFLALLAALDVPQREAAHVADSLVDWIDTDASREPLGAEDAAYARAAGGYRTGGTLLAEVSELRALDGMTPALYARLRPHLCALPTTEPAPVNLNTLGEDDAPVLVMLTGGALRPAAARALLAARPQSGWRDVNAFFAQPELAGLVLPDAVYNQVALRTRYFDLRADVDYLDAEVVLSALLEQDAGGAIRLLARRWTPDE
ncbi:type II secretion system minor pseudopilin GspK [Coralloluteibacterium stylophorae]|uniref:Type II secretion system protein K n=1 Tax=Coralloluteibacterium stylophorae TaxID=1776034 RepID=A0AAP2G369_9GAMM|nr:type II secretion system minor pseudopilin GspK [Coralloluteibacterium stylophorae]